MIGSKQFYVSESRKYSAAHTVLAKTIALISLPSAWTKGSYARNAAGKSVAVRSANAISFDLTGAILKSIDGKNDTLFNLIQDHLRLSIYAIDNDQNKYFRLSVWNDAPHITHDLVISVLRQTKKAMAVKRDNCNQCAINY